MTKTIHSQGKIGLFSDVSSQLVFRVDTCQEQIHSLSDICRTDDCVIIMDPQLDASNGGENKRFRRTRRFMIKNCIILFGLLQKSTL